MKRAAQTMLIPVVLLIGLLSVAAPPETIRYQARLTDDAGVPLSGLVDLTFAIYDADTGGIPLWTETVNGVDLGASNGQIDLVLGGSSPIDASVFSESSRWLEVQVGVLPLGPRRELSSVPFALVSDSVANHTLDDAYDSGGGGAGRTIAADTGAVHISGSGGLHVDDKVGIGTTTPDVALTVGTMEAGTVTGNLGIKSDSNNHAFYIEGPPGMSSGSWQQGVNPGGDLTFFNSTLPRVTFENGGNVGIGIVDPVEALHVSGNAQVDGTVDVTGGITSDGLQVIQDVFNSQASGGFLLDNTGRLELHSTVEAWIDLKDDYLEDFDVRLTRISADQLQIDSADGTPRVGIGVAPTVALQVAGNAQVDGDVDVAQTLTVQGFDVATLLRLMKPDAHVLEANPDQFVIKASASKPARFAIGQNLYTVTSDRIMDLGVAGVGGLRVGVTNTANTLYYIYAVENLGDVALVGDTNDPDTGPGGFSEWSYMGAWSTDFDPDFRAGSRLGNVTRYNRIDSHALDVTTTGLTPVALRMPAGSTIANIGVGVRVMTTSGSANIRLSSNAIGVSSGYTLLISDQAPTGERSYQFIETAVTDSAKQYWYGWSSTPPADWDFLFGINGFTENLSNYP